MRIMLLLNLMYIFQAPNINLLKQLLRHFCRQRFCNEVPRIIDVKSMSCKDDKYMCSFQPNIKCIGWKTYNTNTNIKREKYTHVMHINYEIGIQTSIVLMYGT
jgi:hypothetical protein